MRWNGRIQISRQRRNLYVIERSTLRSGKCWHERASFAGTDPRLPEIHVRWYRKLVQIRHHGRAIGGIMADAADRIIQVFTIFALNILCMTGGTVTLENCLTIY